MEKKKQFRLSAFQSFGLGYDKVIMHLPEPVRVPFVSRYIYKYTFHSFIFLVLKIGWMVREKFDKPESRV